MAKKIPSIILDFCVKDFAGQLVTAIFIFNFICYFIMKNNNFDFFNRESGYEIFIFYFLGIVKKAITISTVSTQVLQVVFGVKRNGAISSSVFEQIDLGIP